MSQENVETIQALYDATAAGDTGAALARIDPEIEINYRGVVPELKDRDLRGHAGVAELMTTITGEFSDFEAHPEEIIDGGEHVVVVVFQRGTGRVSGATVERLVGQVWTVREGRAVRWRIFTDKAEALEAAGLSE